MTKHIEFAPGAVAAGINISLPSGSPPIDSIIKAEVYEGVSQAVNEGGTATYTITVEPKTATATKVDNGTITLDIATTAYSELILTYNEEGLLEHTGVI